MAEKPCKWAENPSGSVWECYCRSVECVHKYEDTNPDGSVNLFECKLGDLEYAWDEIERLQRSNRSFQNSLVKLNRIIQVQATELEHVTRCKDCEYGVDEYNDGDCYCDHDGDLRYIGKNWNHYCGWSKRKEV